MTETRWRISAIATSSRVYAQMFGKFFLVVVAGYALVIATAIHEFGGPGVDIPRAVWVGVGLLAFVVAPLCAFHVVRMERDQFEQERQQLLTVRAWFEGDDEWTLRTNDVAELFRRGMEDVSIQAGWLPPQRNPDVTVAGGSLTRVRARVAYEAWAHTSTDRPVIRRSMALRVTEPVTSRWAWLLRGSRQRRVVEIPAPNTGSPLGMVAPVGPGSSFNPLRGVIEFDRAFPAGVAPTKTSADDLSFEFVIETGSPPSEFSARVSSPVAAS